MWNPRDDDKDSWEVQAFEQDIRGSIMGSTTWPPRSYTCAFCRREFRSAQALGGHMNVHRRDRAKLQHSNSTQPSHLNSTPNNSSSHPSSLAVGGSSHLCSCPRQNPSGVFGVNVPRAFADATSMSFIPSSVSPYSTPPPNVTHPYPNFAVASPGTVDFSMRQLVLDPTFCCLGNSCGLSGGEILHANNSRLEACLNTGEESKEHAAVEELDLELRLGHKAIKNGRKKKNTA